MKSFLKKILQKNHTRKNFYSVDLHSHLVAGIDDGAKTIEDALFLVRGLVGLGFKKLIVTPHTMQHRFNNSSENILREFRHLQAAVRAEGLDIKLEVASEYYLDEQFFDLLEKRDLLTFGDFYLLFEHSVGMKPPDYEALIFEIKVAGYKPVLAHPERYLFLHKEFQTYERLKEMGVYFQLNLNSLSGYYSKEVQKVAHKLVENGWIDFVGSDMHHAKHLKYFSENLHSKNIEKVFHYNKILNQQLL